MLTQHQKKALDFHHHLSVTANAGAGKTTVLVQRFVDILTETRTPVKQLVAITFTEKAASELRKKIAECVEEKITSTIGTEERYLLERIRDQLSSANIGTIHSFCAQLLREFPVEADVDAAFTVLEGVDQEFLEQEAMRETFENILRHSSTSDERDEALEAVRILGRQMVQSYLTTFLKNREHVDRLLRDDGWLSDRRSDDEVLKFWRESTGEFVAAALDDPRWFGSMGRTLDRAAGKLAAEARTLFERWKSSHSTGEKIRLYRELCDLVLTLKGTLRKEFIGAKTDTSPIRNDEKLLADHWKSVEYFLTDEDPNASNRILLRVLRTLLKIYGKIVDRYASKKYGNGQLDFDDLQLKTRELLQQEQIRNRLAEKYSYIMVDEYQDTNQLQYDVLRLLISNFAKGNLFIVGDPKQSIYGFRNADVEIFEVTRRDILTANARGEYGNVTLAESFRLLPAIVDFVNRVFSRAMGSVTAGFEIRYDELVRGRANPSEGRVELLLVPPASEGKSADVDLIKVECRSIASRIAGLVRSGCEVFGVKDEQPHPFRFKDGAILLRGRAHLQELEKALVDFHIPYQLSGGIGFYQTQEVYDFLNYFSFLLNPDDDVALTGVLRSPFFVVPDTELFEASLINGGDTFWGKIGRHALRSAASRELIRAVATLREDLQLANRLPIPFLVQRIFHQTGWRGTVSGLTFGTQNSANIQKLLRIAREFEGKGFLSLYDFVERLRTLAAHEEREGQATLEPSGDCVQIMTIHAAKGLEFPVVFLPFTHKTFRYDYAPHIDQSFGIGFKVKDEKNYDQEVVPEFFQFLQQRNRAKTEAEEKRIFYVGCTRARDILIISGAHARELLRSCSLRWVMEGLGLDAESVQPGRHVLPPARMKVLDQNHDAPKLLEVEHSLAIDISFTGEDAPPLESVGREFAEDRHVRKNHTAPLIAQGQGEIFSATQIRTYLECPAKYYMKYLLGLPDQKAVSYPFDEEEDANDRIRGEVIGALTHRILEEIRDTSIGQPTVRQRVEQLVSIESSVPVVERSAYVDAIARNASNFIESKFGKHVLSASETKLEYSISLFLGDEFLTGTIDRLFRNGDSRWHVLDYKTDDIPAHAIHEHAQIYKSQLATYALLVSRFYQQPEVEASIVFLRHPNSPFHFFFSPSDIVAFEATIRATTRSIRGRKFEPPRESGCETCPYQSSSKCSLPAKTLKNLHFKPV